MDNNGQTNKPEQTKNRRAVGTSYEALAARFLETAGYQILCRNFRTRHGEIDLIAFDQKEEALVFVEVKYRKDGRYGMPAEAVGKRKQEQILGAAERYLSQTGLFASAVRFDVVEILGDKIRVIKNAFTA